MTNYAYFQTIINFKINQDTQETKMTSGWTRAVKGTGKVGKKKPKVVKKEHIEADSVAEAEW